MSSQTIIFLLLSTFAVLAVIDIFLIFYFYRTNKRINVLLENGKIKDFKDVLLSHNEKNKNLEDKIKEAFLKIENLEKFSKKTICRTGLVRFNPFKDAGGDQSFVIALLDDRDNGFVISSIFVKEGNRVYAKAIKAGKSDHTLSKEEKEAIAMAMSSN